MSTGAEVHNLKVKEEQRRATKEDLLEPQKVERDIELERLGGKVVKIKSMSHKTRRKIREEAGVGTAEFDEARFELLAITHSLVEPKLSEDDIEALEDQDGGLIDELVFHIQLLNALGGSEELKNVSSETQS